MKLIRTSKQLTVTYFSIVAFAIIAFHFSMLVSMIENMESIYAKTRMDKDIATATQMFQGTTLTHVSVPPFSEAYLGKQNLPSWVVLEDDVSDDKPYHLDSDSDTNLEFFSMLKKVTINGQVRDLYLIHYDEIYETSEAKMFDTQTIQLVISLLLLVVSLWVVMRISSRLTAPLSSLSKNLASRSPEDFVPIPIPDGAATREIHQLVDHLNGYQNQIRSLIDRERAFNRNASHELRTPLMVMRGGLTLLGKSDSKEFIERQRVRMIHACQEMEDYITTLLSLTRDEDPENLSFREVTQAELNLICRAHTDYQPKSSVVLETLAQGVVHTKLPVAALHILIGNLVKNALACTEEGLIQLIMLDNEIKVVDTGCGLDGKPHGESYGLGLMIVRDICAKYRCEFSLVNNDDVGCTATVLFPLEQEV
ncbi:MULTISPECIES: sensor histidine kinase [Marinomonas]|jgi:signal transduction histidine kinase|uniref:sensor histidine kinase n=1 Tax=Marinomonas TaxID=28253 RepID=UPI0010542555|nr:HAMP domain-containing sensor histidine kinase [Marinomonas sp. KMM3893]